MSDKLNNRNCFIYNCSSKASRETYLSFHSFLKMNQTKVLIINKFDKKEIIDRRLAWVWINNTVHEGMLPTFQEGRFLSRCT